VVVVPGLTDTVCESGVVFTHPGCSTSVTVTVPGAGTVVHAGSTRLETTVVAVAGVATVNAHPARYGSVASCTPLPFWS
jgi:hypothetical protein